MAKANAVAIVNREVRRVPANWWHPIDWNSLRGGGSPRPIGVFEEDMPSVEDLEPSQVRIMLYETTSEGTPMSPVFDDTPEGREALCRYAARYCTTFGSATASEAEWAQMLFGGYAVLNLQSGQLEFSEG